MIPRRITRVLHIGNVPVGGGYPITIQSMTNTDTRDEEGTVRQINLLHEVGCEIVRVAVPDSAAARTLKRIKKSIAIPLIADIHFDYKLALAALRAGADGLRINPGNIGSESKVMQIVTACREKKIPIRIGVNSGSLPRSKTERYGMTAEAMVESALEHVLLLEKAGYHEIKISVKASSVPLTIDSYRLLSDKVDYPLHLGITEAGSSYRGTIKSAVGIGTLLAEGIGDTIRVSLTADPVTEISVARDILKSLGIRKGLNIISCPTCGRTEIDIITLTAEVEKRLESLSDLNISVAVMGCVVNGPGEAREADYGIAGGKSSGLIFRKGLIIKKVKEENLVSELIDIINQDVSAAKID
ncbi:MAG: flavodoxin-dependent (E)-4-hydroxy-3-methylbut-2-enyl-diphosphate synthase [Candidatus Cloacimonetes bacterium]|nr:flavodoxin-dependent (E)-4-hydroxy-3-methylbut-2-enyl-diphosphate synthase [Candidatus Cloacimonadota bacterium]